MASSLPVETDSCVDEKGLAQNVENIHEALDPAAEKRLVRKIDIHLIPILFLLYLCAFIDRFVPSEWCHCVLADCLAE